jgi:hypothetical protein
MFPKRCVGLANIKLVLSCSRSEKIAITDDYLVEWSFWDWQNPDCL